MRKISRMGRKEEGGRGEGIMKRRRSSRMRTKEEDEEND